MPGHVEGDDAVAGDDTRVVHQRTVLPAVVAKGQPLEFREWWPGVAMINGAYDLPIPEGSPLLTPDALLIPVLGIGAHGDRLGYGGGFFDRTLAALDPKPDQVTVTVNTTQMNVLEHMEAEDIAGTSLAEPEINAAYREMIVPSGPGFIDEHVRRLSAAGIQSAFQFYNINSYETVERLIRRGVYKGPLVMNWVAISGGMDAPNIYNLANFLRAIPDGAMLTVESSMRNVLPINMIGMAMGLHVRCGIEDNLWNQSRTAKMTSVQQIEQLVRMSREFGREVANGKEAREILKIGVFYDTVEETLAANGFAPNPKGRQQGYLRKVA